MLNVACVLLAVAVLCLSAATVDLSRRLRSIEDACQLAAESLGAVDHE